MGARKKPSSKRGQWPRRLRPTREGWWFLVATLVLGLAAVNAGLNLLFAIFGMMLFLILASGVMSELALRGLDVRRRMPAGVHAGAPYLIGINVHNHKPRLPTFSLEVEDLAGGKPVERRCYFLKIPATREQETAYRNVLPTRGVYRLTGFRLSTRFPFGLIRKSRDIQQPVDLLVYPALVPVPPALLAGARSNQPAQHHAVPNRSGDFSGLRDFRPGDDPRQIHWRSSAKRRRLLMRESEEESGRTVLVWLRGHHPKGATTGASQGGNGVDPAFEKAVSMAASLALWLLSRGLQVGLLAGDTRLLPSAAPAHGRRILAALAVVGRAENSDAPVMAPGITIYEITPGGDDAIVNVLAHLPPNGQAA